jgi:siroheme synthase
VLLTGHRCAEVAEIDWRAVVRLNATVAVYMPSDRYGDLAAALADAGMPPATPCLIASHATLSDEQTCTTTLAELKNAPRLPAPALLIVGRVAAARDAEGRATMAALEGVV